MECKSILGVTSMCSNQYTTPTLLSESIAISPEEQHQVPGEIQVFPSIFIRVHWVCSMMNTWTYWHWSCSYYSPWYYRVKWKGLCQVTSIVLGAVEVNDLTRSNSVFVKLNKAIISTYRWMLAYLLQSVKIMTDSLSRPDLGLNCLH